MITVSLVPSKTSAILLFALSSSLMTFAFSQPLSNFFRASSYSVEASYEIV